MFRRCSACVFVLTCALTCVQAADAPKGTSNPVVMVARFHDGSVIHQVRLAEVFQVKTKFGELSIPLDSIKRVEFAVRLSEEQSDQIDKAIKQLNSKVFSEREAASRQLAAFGVRATGPLQEAARSGEAEVTRRAQAVLDQIRRTVPGDIGASGEKQDVIYTADSVILRGQISAGKLKGDTTTFGPLQISLSDLRSLSLPDRHERLNVDSEALAQAPDPWLETGIQLEAGEGLNISASGKINLAGERGGFGRGLGRLVSGPNGIDDRFGEGGPGSDHRPGRLMGRIGKDGTPFLVGERYQGKVTQSGKLYLHVVLLDEELKPKGSYQVRISTGWSAGQE